MSTNTQLHPGDPRREGFQAPEMPPAMERRNRLASFADSAQHGVNALPSTGHHTALMQQIRETVSALRPLCMACGEPNEDTHALVTRAKELQELMGALAIANPKLATQFYLAPVIGPIAQLLIELSKPLLATKAAKA